MSAPTKTWKAFERTVAAYFGCLRNRMSGSSGRADLDPSDSDHPRLYIECKLRQEHWVYAVWRDATESEKKAAKHQKREPRPVVVCLKQGGKPGFLVCCHNDELEMVASERRYVRFDEEMDE